MLYGPAADIGDASSASKIYIQHLGCAQKKEQNVNQRKSKRRIEKMRKYRNEKTRKGKGEHLSNKYKSQLLSGDCCRRESDLNYNVAKAVFAVLAAADHVCMYNFLRRCGHSPCGASASYMF